MKHEWAHLVVLVERHETLWSLTDTQQRPPQSARVALEGDYLGSPSSLPLKRLILRWAELQHAHVEASLPLKAAHSFSGGLLNHFCLVFAEDNLASGVTDLANRPERSVGLTNLES